MSITILHHKYRRLLLGILYIVMGTIRYQIYNRIACDDSVSDWYKINLGSSVGTLFALSHWRASRIAFGVDKTIVTHTKGHIETLQT